MTDTPSSFTQRLATTGGNRLRLVQLGAAVLLVFAAAQSLDPPFYISWWFWVGVSTAASTVLLEPHFTAPRAALTNAVGAVAVYFTATRDGFLPVWFSYLGLAILVQLAALVVLTEERFRDRPFLAWITTRFGRAVRVSLECLSQTRGIAPLGVTKHAVPDCTPILKPNQRLLLHRRSAETPRPYSFAHGGRVVSRLLKLQRPNAYHCKVADSAIPAGADIPPTWQLRTDRISTSLPDTTRALTRHFLQRFRAR